MRAVSVNSLCSASVIAALLLILAPELDAQVAPPFFAPTGTSFTPEIGVVNSGVINDVQAVVSADEKYVTLTMRPSSSRLLALQEFTFQNGGSVLGFVGSGGGNAGAGANGAVRAGGRNAKPAAEPAYPDGRPTIRSILDRSGTFRVNVSEDK